MTLYRYYINKEAMCLHTVFHGCNGKNKMPRYRRDHRAMRPIYECPENTSNFALIVLDAPPDGTPSHIRMYFIFLENRSKGLHFAADNVSLSSLKFLFWALEFLYISASGAFRPFKVIQGH